MPERLTATASVATATPERYAKQLAAHLGRRCEVREQEDGVLLVLADGDCLLRPSGETLEMRVSAPERAGVDRVASVVGSHLERFGRRGELRVVWSHG